MFGTRKRDRGALSALALALIAIVAVAYIDASTQSPSQRKMNNEQTANIDRAPQDDVAQPISRGDDFEFWQDTFPQWIMAIFSIAATAISWRAIFLVRDTLEVNRQATTVARDAVNEARRIGELQVRGYPSFLGVEVIYEPLAHMFVGHVVLANSGNSPIQKMVIKGSMICNLQLNGRYLQVASASHPAAVPDLGASGTETFPVEFSIPPVSRQFCAATTFAEVVIVLTGEDIFGHSFEGKLAAQFHNGGVEWTNIHRGVILSGATTQPRYTQR